MDEVIRTLAHPVVAALVAAAGIAALLLSLVLTYRHRARPALVTGGAAAVLLALSVGVMARGADPLGAPGAALLPETAAVVAAESECGEAEVAAEELVMRPEPSDSAPPMFTLRRGDRVTIVCGRLASDAPGSGVRWTPVRYAMFRGWVAEKQADRVNLRLLPPEMLRNAER
jgi:hypothetical protein